MRRTGNCSALPAIGMYVSGISNTVRMDMEVSAALDCAATLPAASAAATCSNSRRLLVGMLTPAPVCGVDSGARPTRRRPLAYRPMLEHDGVERSIILLVLVAVPERKFTGVGFGKRRALGTPGLSLRQHVHFVS